MKALKWLALGVLPAFAVGFTYKTSATTTADSKLLSMASSGKGVLVADVSRNDGRMAEHYQAWLKPTAEAAPAVADKSMDF